MSTRARLLVAVVLIAGAAIRFYVASSQPMWRDEAQTIAISRLSWPVGILRGLAADGNSPLFYLAQHWVTANAPREAQDRSISVLAGVLAIALAGVLAHELGGSAAAGAIMLTVSPLAIDLGSQARPYAALTVAGLVMAICAVRIEDRWFAYGAAGVCAFYLHAAAGAILIASFAVALLRSRGWIKHHVAIAIAIAPGLVFFAQQVSAVTVRGRFVWAAEHSLQRIVRGAAPLLAGAPTGTFLYLIATAVVALALFATWRGDSGRQIIAIAIVISFVLTGAFSWFTGALESRYGVVPSALLLILAVSPRRWVVAAMVAAYVAFAALDAGLIPAQRSSSRDVAAFVASHVAASDLVIVVPDVYAVSLNYYLPRTVAQIDPPSLARVDRMDFRRWWPGDSKPVTTAIATRPKAWLVVSEPLLRSLPPETASNPIVVAQWRYAQDVIAAFNAHYSVGRPVRFTQSLEPAVIFEGKEKGR